MQVPPMKPMMTEDSREDMNERRSTKLWSDLYPSINRPSQSLAGFGHHPSNSLSSRHYHSKHDLLKLQMSSLFLRPKSHIIHTKDASPPAAETEWVVMNERQCSRSSREWMHARRLKDDVVQALRNVDVQSRQRQRSNRQKLESRISKIDHWKEELAKEIENMKKQILDVNAHVEGLEKFLKDVELPMSVSKRCRKERMKRTGTDAIRDRVEINLLKEIEMLKNCQTRVKTFIPKALEQNRINQLALEACLEDHHNKRQAKDIDNKVMTLEKHSEKLNNIEIDSIGINHPKMTVPTAWSRFTMENIQRSKRERENSEKLCNSIKDCLRSSIYEVISQFIVVNASFTNRVYNLDVSKTNLQSQLLQIENQCEEQKRMAKILEHKISEMEAPLRLAVTKLMERQKRNAMELCRDSATKGLQLDFNESREALKTMKGKLMALYRSIEKLHRVQNSLEAEVAVKENSLDIDARVCLPLRKALRSQRDSLTHNTLQEFFPAFQQP